MVTGEEEEEEGEGTGRRWWGERRDTPYERETHNDGCGFTYIPAS